MTVALDSGGGRPRPIGRRSAPLRHGAAPLEEARSRATIGQQRTGASGYWWQAEVNFYPLVLKLGSNLIILKKDLQVNSCRLA